MQAQIAQGLQSDIERFKRAEFKEDVLNQLLAHENSTHGDVCVHKFHHVFMFFELN